MLILYRLMNELKNGSRSQAEIARELCVNKGMVSKWASGKSNPSLENFVKLAASLDVSPEWLLELDVPKRNFGYYLSIDKESQTLACSKHSVTNEPL